ncbi:hypothetical protein ABPG72_008898 [Tetrahymena utriculariae]
MSFLKFFNKQLETNPLRTKMITSTLTYSAGDFVAQKYFEKSETYSYQRALKSIIYGSLFAAPVLHKWHNLIPVLAQRYIFYRFNDVSKYTRAFVKMIIDQTMFAPVFNCYFYIMINLIEYQSFQKGVQSIQDKLWETLKSGWKLWPLAQIINFSFVPIQYRVLYGNMVAMFWFTYLSYMQHKHKQQIQNDNVNFS